MVIVSVAFCRFDGVGSAGMEDIMKSPFMLFKEVGVRFAVYTRYFITIMLILGISHGS